jgi:hypothetical protein
MRVTFVVNSFKTTSKFDRIQSGSSGSGSTVSIPCMDCFVIHVEEMRRVEIARERDRDSDGACCSFSPALERGTLQV